MKKRKKELGDLLIQQMLIKRGGKIPFTFKIALFLALDYNLHKRKIWQMASVDLISDLVG